MSPRKTILRQLNAAAPGELVRPSDISGFAKQPPKYREAVNGLLRDQLVTGSKDDDGNLVIGINGQRRPEVLKELRPWFGARAVVGVALGVAAVAFLAFF